MTSTQDFAKQVRDAADREEERLRAFWSGIGSFTVAAVAGIGTAVALAGLVREGVVSKTVAYVIVGLVCLWLASIGADRAVKRRRAAK